MRVQYDAKHRFAAGFDPDTGVYYRTNTRDILGQDTGCDPFMASFPHFLDVGIMGYCTHGLSGRCREAGIHCYLDGGTEYQDNMTLEEFGQLVDQCAGRTFQFALGGRGDPDQHADFAEMLRLCRDSNIVPNFATSGWALNPEKAEMCAEYCGTVAVSWQRGEHTFRAVDMLLQAGVRTNIHFLLGRNSLDEARMRLENDTFPSGINRVIFLLYKPAGGGRRDNMLVFSDPRVHKFYSLFDEEQYRQLSGVDSCSVPALLNMAPRIHPTSVEACEGARFTAYVSPDLQLKPCSFDVDGHWAVDLHSDTVEEAWNSDEFEDFRGRLQNQCPDCTRRQICLGGCPIERDVVLCADAAGKIQSEGGY